MVNHADESGFLREYLQGIFRTFAAYRNATELPSEIKTAYETALRAALAKDEGDAFRKDETLLAAETRMVESLFESGWILSDKGSTRNLETMLHKLSSDFRTFKRYFQASGNLKVRILEKSQNYLSQGRYARLVQTFYFSGNSSDLSAAESDFIGAEQPRLSQSNEATSLNG